MTPLQLLDHPLFNEKKVRVYVKRDDLIHPFISGNKWRKGQPVIEHMKKAGIKTALTFGGAFSNHIYSFAYACKEAGIHSIGIIRGDELANKPLNKTLLFAKQQGMELIFVSRQEYKDRNNPHYIEKLKHQYNAYVVPEGGTTFMAKEGFKKMLDEIHRITDFDHIMTASGTGGTIAGICANLKPYQHAISIPVLKGVKNDIEKVINQFSNHHNYSIIEDYSFGGYGKTNEDLIYFINWFERFYFEIEQVYTAKMLYALFDLVRNNYFKENTTIVVCHTGGLQGKNI